ncbi:NAD(P)/FAD-dependent oxidoreductase [Halotia wernerae UHCC 0503]|nr:NAD(P)/FAD-dependent oxidoreductase [Halotia wernerae UHCC 0503]
MTDYDAIVVGAGHNGLVSALYLARAGLNVLVLERNKKIGGAVQSGEITRPGFVHDLWSTNQNLFLASPVYKELKDDLERHGLKYANSPKPYCCLFPDGKSLHVYSDRQKTLDLLHQHNPKDATGWSALYDHFQEFQKSLLPLYATPLPSPQVGVQLTKALAAVGFAELVKLAQILASSTRQLGLEFFETREARALISTWGMHLDFGPDVAGGAMFPFLETFSDMREGMNLAQGGAAKMPAALAGLAQEYGAEILTQTEVTRIIEENGQAIAVQLANGDRISAKRAIIANLTPDVLFHRLLQDEPIPAKVHRDIEGYTYGPATMMVHLALKGKPKWKGSPETQDFAYVHIAPYVEDLAQTYNDSMNGILPANPLLIVGQTSVVDPTRTPSPDEHILWVQVRTLPPEIKGDAKKEIQARNWDEAKEPFSDRVLQKLEDYAPGIRKQILDMTVFSPADLERHNPNLVGGDSIGGSHHLRQNFLFRPFPNYSNYKMPLDHLYMVGAGTWPGAGTNATSGYLCAQEIINTDGLVKKLVGGVAIGAVVATGVAVKKMSEQRHDKEDRS